ncbi:MAG: PaaI family thioesterase [Acidobacteriota bacterium]|nr:PaaI family thioesterase [Acidobacteriota bacterium]
MSQATGSSIFDREDRLERLNNFLGGFVKSMGLRYVRAEPEEIVAELEIAPHLLQPYGLVHGGVYCSIIESVCSAGAALHVMAEGKNAVGLENTTTFLRAARSGTLRCTAKPLKIGRRTHVWNADIHDDEDRPIASGRVRMMILDPGDRAGGREVRIEDP